MTEEEKREIPERHLPLLEFVKDSYGTHQRTKEFLERFHHPVPQGDLITEELRRISLEDFYTYNSNPEGKRALEIEIGIYAELISREKSDSVKEKSIGYLLEYLQKILADSGEHLSRNIPLVLQALDFLHGMPREEVGLMKKRTRDLKLIIKFFIDHNIQAPVKDFSELCSRVFQASFSFWLGQPDPLYGYLDFKGQPGQ